MTSAWKILDDLGKRKVMDMLGPIKETHAPTSQSIARTSVGIDPSNFFQTVSASLSDLDGNPKGQAWVLYSLRNSVLYYSVH